MTGIELITQERKEQVEKHGRDIEHDFAFNNDQQLRRGALYLLTYDYGEIAPKGWSDEIFSRMKAKPYKDRLVIAGALIAAEIDRLIRAEEYHEGMIQAYDCPACGSLNGFDCVC